MTPLIERLQREDIHGPVLAEESAILVNGSEIRATLSLGVAIFPDMGDNGSDVISAADHALYGSKRQGRNRTQVSATKARPEP
jgi:GGDEF domain-containing protein